MNNTITQTEELVNNSNQPLTNKERVISLLDSEISRIQNLKETLKDDSWETKIFEDTECNFFDYTDVDSINLKKIENWLNLQFDIDQLYENKWEHNWEQIVSEELHQYHSSDFDFVYEEWRSNSYETEELIDKEIRCQLGY